MVLVTVMDPFIRLTPEEVRYGIEAVGEFEGLV